MQVFRTDFLFLTIMSHKKNAQVSRRRFSVGIGIHKLIFFRQAFAQLCLEKKIKKKRFVTTLNYNLQKYICKIMEEKKRSPTEEDNDEEGRRSSRRKKAKVCPELTRLSLCCYKCSALCSNIFAFIILQMTKSVYIDLVLLKFIIFSSKSVCYLFSRSRGFSSGVYMM